MVERFVQTSPIIDMDAALLPLESSFIEQTQEAVKQKVWKALLSCPLWVWLWICLNKGCETESSYFVMEFCQRYNHNKISILKYFLSITQKIKKGPALLVPLDHSWTNT